MHIPSDSRAGCWNTLAVSEFRIVAQVYSRLDELGTVKVPDSEKMRYAKIVDEGAFDVTSGEQECRSGGWNGFDPAATPFTAENVRREREAYRITYGPR